MGCSVFVCLLRIACASAAALAALLGCAVRTERRVQGFCQRRGEALFKAV